MKKNFLSLAGAAVGAVASLTLVSCYYDPSYSSGSVGGSYNSGYGQGYGYGSSRFSTSLFVSTGNAQWGYDPNCYSYYDYHRRAYYDPYLRGYYPVGYRPPVVYGVPHPYGWHNGGSSIRPPAYVSGGIIRNYENRATQYRGTTYDWAHQVKQGPASQGRVVDSHSSSSSNNRKPDVKRSSSNSSSYYKSNKTTSSTQATRQNTNTNTSSNKQKSTLPSRYNNPVKMSDQKSHQGKVSSSHPPSQNGKQNNNSENKDSKKYR